MSKVKELQKLVEKFTANLNYYKNPRNVYNEHSCRIEYIDQLLILLGWDVANAKGLAPQYREVIAENYSTATGRPDYSLTLRGITKFFVEAKKPAVDIMSAAEPALQARKYGWNANHNIVVLTNFEYWTIYDTTVIPQENEGSHVARYRTYHYTEYVERYDEILSLLSRDAVYSGSFDEYFNEQFSGQGRQKQQVDVLFLEQINRWRLALSNELYKKGGRYKSIDILNDVVQEFINQIVFLRICEDKSLPLYHKLQEATADPAQLQKKLEELLKMADRRYNSGIFSGESIIFDLSSEAISDIIKGLYYPQSPYLFNMIEPNLLGKIYEVFLTEQLVLLSDGTIGLRRKKDCVNRSIVTTPTEIVRYMTDKAMSCLCEGKTPAEILELRIADIACGSGVYLEATFEYLQNYCIEWYLRNGKAEHLIEIRNGLHKLPLEEKKALLCSCIFGVDIDIHAVEVAKFSLLIKLIEDETAPSVEASSPILPDLARNILFGNALVSDVETKGLHISNSELVDIAPLNWKNINNGEEFDAIIGNPPYVSTEGLHALVPVSEFGIYKQKYLTAYKQFDKYFIFLERAIQKTKDGGFVCYIVPNKFFKVGAGKKLRQLIADGKMLVSLDDFGDVQLFEDKTIYSSIVFMQKQAGDEFAYSSIESAAALWAGEEVKTITFKSEILNELPWRLTTDIEFLSLLQKLDEVAVPLERHAEIFNGIQTSAESPPIYWFSMDMVCEETHDAYTILKDGKKYLIEKALLKIYFKPTKKSEKGLNTYSVITTNKRIIFPYDENGRLIPIDTMKTQYPGTYAYLEDHYDRLVPKCVSKAGTRDVQRATADTWYQYGRSQGLTAFNDTPKLIVGVMSKEAMYAYDNKNMLTSPGGTAGYCSVSQKVNSPYALEYIQAWLTNPYTERILEIVGSDFEGGFISRGTFVLKTLPFVELDFTNPAQKVIYDRVVEATREIYQTNEMLASRPAKNAESVMRRKKAELIAEIEELIGRVYRLEF